MDPGRRVGRWVLGFALCALQDSASRSVVVAGRSVAPNNLRRLSGLSATLRGGAKKAKKPKKKVVVEVEEQEDDDAESIEAELHEFRCALDEGIAGVGLSAKLMSQVGVKTGDLVRVHGARRSATLARVTLVDEEEVVSVSTAVFENLRKGSVLWLTRCSVGVAERVELSLLTPREVLGEGVDDDALFADCVAPHFKSTKRSPLRVGDVVSCDLEREDEEALTVRWRVEGLDTTVVGDFVAEGIVDSETEIAIAAVDGIEAEEETRKMTYEDLGGVDAQIELLKEVLELPLQQPYVFAAIGVPPPRGVLLTGPAGCGKSALARAAAHESGAHVETIMGPEMLSKRPGEAEEALRAKFAAAEANAPAIVLIDDIDALGKKRNKASNEAEKRLCSQLLTLLDGLRPSSGVVVLGATSKPNELDPALRRFGRLDREVELPVPDAEAREQILTVLSRDMRLAEDVDLEAISRDSHGFVGADLAQLCTEAALTCVRQGLLDAMPADEEDEDDEEEETRFIALAAKLAAEDEARPEHSILAVQQSHFVSALKQCNPSSLRESVVEVPDVSWADVGGLEEVKRELKETVEYPVQYARHYDAFGLPPSKGVLFYGPPGCGKTLIAKAVANECGANFISVKGPELLTMWFGESEANVRSLFDKARAAAPCILFFDEMDSIAKARSASASGSDAGDRVMNQILAEIDGVGTKNVFVIGATNRPDILDPAVTRPGRLDQLIHIPLPDYESRLSVFKAALRKAPLDPTMSIDKLAAATAGFSGADISEICQRAAKNAVKAAVDAEILRKKQRIKAGVTDDDDEEEETVPFILKTHFEESMSRARRSVPQSEIDRYNKFSDQMKTSAKSNSSSTFSFAGGGFS